MKRGACECFFEKKKMYPFKRPSGTGEEEMREWEKSKVEWFRKNKPVEYWPWSVLRMFQQENGILQSGARDLQNQRVNAFLQQSFVSTREIAKNTTIPQFTRYPFRLRSKQDINEECGMLHIHKDVLKVFIIRKLVDDPRSIFSLMLTCKDLQGICQETLCLLAQKRFGPQGTPKALMIASYSSVSKRQKLSRKPVQELKRACGLTGRDFKVAEVEKVDADDIVKISIKKYGLIDNLEKVRENDAKKEAYAQKERIYVLSQIDERVRQVNERFEQFGYVGMSVRFDKTMGACVWADSRIEPILVVFELDNDYKASRVLKDTNDWVLMKTDSKVGKPNVAPDMFNAAISHLEVGVKIHPLMHIVLESLMEIKQREYFLYGKRISEDEWKSRLENLFSPAFSKRNPFPFASVDGSWLCCWAHENSHVKLIRIFDHPQPRLLTYHDGMRGFENRYQIRMGLPPTGLSYASHVPIHLIKGRAKISFAHALLIKKH